MPVFNNTDELVTDAMQLDGNSGCCWLNIFVGGIVRALSSKAALKRAPR